MLPANTHLSGTVEVDYGAYWADDKKVVAIFCPGDLNIDGDLLNQTISSGMSVIVGGNLIVQNLVNGGGRFLIGGNVKARGFVIGNSELLI